MKAKGEKPADIYKQAFANLNGRWAAGIGAAAAVAAGVTGTAIYRRRQPKAPAYPESNLGDERDRMFKLGILRSADKFPHRLPKDDSVLWELNGVAATLLMKGRVLDSDLKRESSVEEGRYDVLLQLLRGNGLMDVEFSNGAQPSTVLRYYKPSATLSWARDHPEKAKCYMLDEMLLHMDGMESELSDSGNPSG